MADDALDKLPGPLQHTVRAATPVHHRPAQLLSPAAVAAAPLDPDWRG